MDTDQLDGLERGNLKGISCRHPDYSSLSLLNLVSSNRKTLDDFTVKNAMAKLSEAYRFSYKPSFADQAASPQCVEKWPWID